MAVRKRASRRSDIALAYQRLFDSDDGRKVLHDLMKRCHVLHPINTPGDPYMTAFHDGERYAVLRIMQMINMDPAQLMIMIKEGQEEDKKYEQ